MYVDTTLRNVDLASAGRAAAKAEAAGYDGVWVTDTAHDPFLALALAAEQTERVTLGTAVAIAFARSPMTVAVTANDLQSFSGGRLVLGLGTQVAAHVQRRFSMPWSQPAARMREYVLALRAIWAAWNEGAKLDFRGDFYTHTLMTPNFAPEPNPHGAPPVYIAGVGPLMTEVAGEVADGFLAHAFSTERYMREVTLPALGRGLERGGRSRADVVLCGGALVVTGTTDAEVEAALAETRARLGFYASTPQYRPVLDLHGWGELQPELNRLTKEGRWDALPGLIDDELLRTFAVVGSPEEVAAEVKRRFGDVADRVGTPTLARTSRDALDEIQRLLRSPA